MSRPITAYEANLDNKDRRGEWMEKRWPELCEEMTKAATAEIGGVLGSSGGAEAVIKDMLEDSGTLAEICYKAETRESEQ